MIIVLTLSRSGSSLMMQTLKILGIEVIGTDFVPGVREEHNRLNPKGFYEMPNIYAKGLQELSLHDSKTYHQKALKINLLSLSNPDKWQDWQDWHPSIEHIWITIREPLEQAHSKYRLLNHHKELSDYDRKQETFLYVIKFLKLYVSTFCSLAEVLENQLAVLKPKISILDYRQPINNPKLYIENILATLALAPSPNQQQQAIDNIETNLYNFREDFFLNHQKMWAEKTYAKQVYQILSNTAPDQVWQELLQFKLHTFKPELM